MTWTTAEDGTVTIDGETPMLSGQALAIYKDRVLGPWGDDARANAGGGVSASDILAVIDAETHGNEKAVSGDGGFGLMQLTSSGARAGLSNEQLLDGPQNIAAGAAYMKRIRNGQDLPRLAATYNAGSARPSSGNRWGLVSSPGYLDRVVSASNTGIALGVNEGGSGGGTPSTGDKLIRLGCSLLAALGLGYTLARVMR